MNNTEFPNLKTFDFWCQKVLPLVYDDSLSYYEILCKVVDYLNKVIEAQNGYSETFKKLAEEIAIIEEWIKKFDTSYVEKIIEQKLATMIFVEITDSGYFVYYVPEKWSDIKFNTTGKDINISGVEYGRLVLSY